MYARPRNGPVLALFTPYCALFCLFTVCPFQFQLDFNSNVNFSAEKPLNKHYVAEREGCFGDGRLERHRPRYRPAAGRGRRHRLRYWKAAEEEGTPFGQLRSAQSRADRRRGTVISLIDPLGLYCFDEALTQGSICRGVYRISSNRSPGASIGGGSNSGGSIFTMLSRWSHIVIIWSKFVKIRVKIGINRLKGRQ